MSKKTQKEEKKNEIQHSQEKKKMAFSPKTGDEQSHTKLLAQNDFNFDNIKIKKEYSPPPKNNQQITPELQASLNSLNKVDIATVIDNLNFDFNQPPSSSTETSSKINNVNQSNENKFDFNFPPKSNSNAQEISNKDIVKQNENILVNMDFFNLLSEGNNKTNQNHPQQNTQNNNNNNNSNPPLINNQINNTIPQNQTETSKQINFDILNLSQTSSNNNEDNFDPIIIQKRLRCSLLEKGTFEQEKGIIKEPLYRGQILLELSNGFSINKKTLYLKINHSNWTDHNFFSITKLNSIVKNEMKNQYELLCKNIKTNSQEVIDYTPCQKLIKLPINLNVSCRMNEGKYELIFECRMIKNIVKQFRMSQILIKIIHKTQINDKANIIRTNNSNYRIEDDNKTISYLINDFTQKGDFGISILFNSNDTNFVEIVKVTYRYMNLLPTNLEGEMFYNDENGMSHPLVVVKKCQIESKFVPEIA